MQPLTQEAIAYLKSKPDYARILKAVIDKYKKLGHLGGYIILEQLTAEEQTILAPLDYSIYKTKACKIKVQHFVQQFCMGRFEEVDFLEVLKGYMNSELLSNRQVKEDELKQKELFFAKLIAEVQNEELKAWLQVALRDKKQGYQILMQLYTQQKRSLPPILKALKEAIDCLEEAKGEWMPLPLLASKATKDAHYFDLSTAAGKLLLYVLSFQKQAAYPATLTDVNELLYSTGIIRDEISNMTACYGLIGTYKNQKAPWEAFWELGQPLQLTVSNLKEVSCIYAPQNKVYIVENPAVFMQLLQQIISLPNKMSYGLICTSGQLNTSSYMLLDKLAASETIMYYNGDFDPEGLQIAERLKKRYEKKLVLWHYTPEDYLKVKGKVSIKERLDKLKKVKHPELEEVIKALQQEGVAGYQELLIEELAKDIFI